MRRDDEHPKETKKGDAGDNRGLTELHKDDNLSEEAKWGKGGEEKEEEEEAGREDGGISGMDATGCSSQRM